MGIGVCEANLGRLSERVGVPGYERAGLSAGIVHFGIGNFHRAHQAVYLDDLFASGRDQDWAILGAGVRAADRKMAETLGAQDWLTTVVSQDAGGRSARITGAMIGHLPVGDPEAVTAALADPAIRIVSMTITEGGYFIDPATGRFDPDHPEIRADAERPAAPGTVFGLIVGGLRARRDKGVPPFTVMSCDNIPHNGAVARNAVVGLARLSDPALADWIAAEVAFPNSMVDRITPVTTDRERAVLEAEFGVTDGWPVFCETFRQWVLEDRFPAGRPRLETVGVTFVPDVAPYELMKIRILNGGHAAIAYPAALMDIVHVHEAMAEPAITAFLERLEREEIIPMVPEVPGVNLDDYYESVAERFANPKVADTVARLCQDGSNRQPKFILPSTRDRLAAGAGVTGLALVSAAWCRYCAGTSDGGAALPLDDLAGETLRVAARKAETEPGAFIGQTAIFGELGGVPAFADAFAKALGSLSTRGTRATLLAYGAGDL
ncbi:mannitol dehydrogenase family protein [Arsenicitalea aurantiaca]|uniref:Mannitol dehydrogenase family protein n=1 Tax=Arsenicitalea aurantiaca TaxID=1783274 RepID=A0A433XLK4_9HYPH|nr:mannitol dehydrogenase family protein [Arsenicitalea aurantiaca]RUT34904.1 mannitol dehydrogenase family protein [Arsenicitalea aurantiaca]